MSERVDSPHLSPGRAALWWSGGLSLPELLAVTAHVHGCEDCRAMLTERFPAETVAHELAAQLDGELAAGHLEREELGGWVDGTLPHGDAGSVAAHLVACEICRAEAVDLAKFAATLGEGQARPGQAAPRPAIPTRPISPLARLPRRAFALGALAAAVVALVLAGRAWLDGGPATQVSPPTATPQPTRPVPTAETPAPDLRDGPLVLTADGRLRGIDERWRGSLEAAIRRPILLAPGMVTGLIRTSGRQRTADGEPPPVVPEFPLSRVVLDGRPRFAWTAPAAHGPFRVEVFDTAFRQLAVSPPLLSTTWVPDRPLPSEEVLTWQVVSLSGDEPVVYPQPPAAPATFLVVPRGLADEIAAARASGSRLVAGLALWRGGLLPEAVEELAALARENPTSAVARRLADSSAAELERLRRAGPS